MIYYVGIDIAKLNHYAAIKDSDNNILIKPFKFTNDANGFKSLTDVLESFDKDSIIIGMESTAHYADNLINYLFNLGYKVALINPIQTSSLRKSNIRNTKNDKIDTLLIIKSLQINSYKLISEDYITSNKLKCLTRYYDKLIKLRSSEKVKLKSYLDLVFPEYQYFFKSGIYGKASFSVLMHYSTASEIAKLDVNVLTEILRSNSHGKFKENTALNLIALAKTSVGINDSSIAYIIKSAISIINTYSEQINNLEHEIASYYDSSNSPILSVPGISTISGATIIGEVGDINKFETSGQLLAYAGLDPVIRQSGNFNASHTRMSKRGSKHLRRALILIAHNIVKNNLVFHDYYTKKRSEGKSHYCSLGHVAHKLVRILFKILKEDIEFELSY